MTPATSPERAIEVVSTATELASYYREIGPWMLPHLRGRFVTLVHRAPGGSGTPRIETYATIDSVAELTVLTERGVVEIRVWGSRIEHLYRPDRLAFELSAGVGVGWAEIVAAGRELRALLSQLRLESYPCLHGERLLVVVPVEPELDWDQSRALCRALAELCAARGPERYITNALRIRRAGRISIDYLVSRFASPTVAPYSACTDGSIAVPVGWEELRAFGPPPGFRVATIGRRLSALAHDPWIETLSPPPRVPTALSAHLLPVAPSVKV